MATKKRKFKQTKPKVERQNLKPVTKITKDEVWQKKIRNYLKNLRKDIKNKWQESNGE